MFSGDMLTISGLYAVVSGSEYSLTKADIKYDTYSSPRGSCTVNIAGKSVKIQPGTIVSGLDANDIDNLCKVFAPGTAVKVVCDLNVGGGSNKTRHILFSGFVASAQDTTISSHEYFRYEFSVTMATPEALVPTNPNTLTYHISQAPAPLSLVSDALLMNSARTPAQIALDNALQAELLALSSSSELNVAKIAAMAIDKRASTMTTATDLPTSISSLFDASESPIIICPMKQAGAVANTIVDMVNKLQLDGRSDWDVFVMVLRHFYQNPTPYVANTDQNAPVGKMKIKKYLPWSSSVAVNIAPADFTSFQNMHIASLAGMYRAVAVEYPSPPGTSFPSTDELNEHVLCAMGYDATGNPKLVTGTINRVQAAGDYMLNGVRIQNILKLRMPNWLYTALDKIVGNGTAPNLTYNDLYKDWAMNIAVTSVLSSIGAQGSLLLHSRLLPTIELTKYLGEVVSVDLPAEPPRENKTLKTHKVYGMLRLAELSIILKADGLSASGKLVLDATRTEAEQQAFCIKSDLFANA